MQHAERPDVDEVLAADHNWYHVVELAPGVTTSGFIDLRAHVDGAGLPADLSGLRALDVGTFDGFWAFELEKRGAQVIGIDVDQIPPPDTPRDRWAAVQQELAGKVTGTGFALLKSYFGSSVDRRSLNVYDLTADKIDGPVDLAFIGAMLLHLRDPVGALEAVRSVLEPGGRLVLFEPVDRQLSRKKEPLARFLQGHTIWTWWLPNAACLRDWVTTAGFTDLTEHGHRDVADSTGRRQRLLALHARA
ncbi:MAG TPA: methyltransferase domain-containing protein [Mycobacteriales bacterium]|nr:methyltransferase domain-containing protein [Mycobacteriales bacterium]